MKNAVIYCRVSTEEQAEGVSLEAQEAKCLNYAKDNSIHVYGFYVDDSSGKDEKHRLEFQKAVESCCKNKATLIVYSISRASRSVMDLYSLVDRLEKAGADFVSLTEHFDTTTAAGKMFFGIMAVLAQFERELISERTKMALAHKKSKGERTGGVPYGMKLAKDGVHLLPNEEELDTLAYILDLRAGGASIRGIQEKLMVEGILNRNGKAKWRLQTLAKFCRTHG